MIEGAVIDRAYTVNKHGTICHYFVRGTDGKKHHIESYVDVPYIYADVTGLFDHPDVVDVSNPTYTTQCGEKVSKITVKLPKSVSGYTRYHRDLGMSIEVEPVKELHAFRKTFEDNIEFPDRCAVDHNIKYGVRAFSKKITVDEQIAGIETEVMPTIATLDTEVFTYQYDPESGQEEAYVEFPDVTNPTNEIMSLQILDNQTEEIYLFRMHNNREDYVGYKKGTYKFDRSEKNNFELPFFIKKKYQKRLKAKLKFTVHEHVFMNEKSMLQFFINFLLHKQYDIIAAFNGMRFDFPYVLTRMQYLKLKISSLSPLGYITKRVAGSKYKGKYVEDTDIRIPGTNIMDTMILFKKKVYEKRAKNSLDSFAKDYLEVGKATHDPIEGRRGKKHSIDYEFYKQLPKFQNYACRDVILDYYLQKILGIWEHNITLVKISGCQIRHVTQPRKQLRQRTLFYAKEMGLVVEKESYGKGRFKGATVVRPENVGIFKMAADLDLTSQYPSMIQAWNISWDTLIVDHDVPEYSDWHHIMDIKEAQRLGIPYCTHPLEGVYFRVDRIGLYPKMIADTRGDRDAVRFKLSILTTAQIELRKGKTIASFENVYKEGKLVATAEQMQEILIEIGYDINESYEFNDEFIEAIKEQWDNDQSVLKVVINSIYGNLPPFLASCVTAAARVTIAITRRIIATLKYPSKYTDTDSVIFQTRQKTVAKADKLAMWLTKKINEGYRRLEKKLNLIPNWLDIKSEEIYDPIIFIYKKSSSTNEAASKVYIKRLVGDRGKILAQPKLSHKGLLKKMMISKFSVDLGQLLIYYCGMNYDKSIIESRVRALKRKLFQQNDTLDIPADELDDMKNQRLALHEGRYTLDEISFPMNIRKSWEEYKVLDYKKKAVLRTNKYMKRWSSTVRYYGRGDTAFIIFVTEKSMPDGMIPIVHKVGKEYSTTVWSLDHEGELHPDFEVDYYPHFVRALERYKPLLKVMGIKHQQFTTNPNQKTLMIN